MTFLLSLGTAVLCFMWGVFILFTTYVEDAKRRKFNADLLVMCAIATFLILLAI